MRRICLLFVLLCASAVSLKAQSLVFVHNGVELEDNATITVSEIDDLMFTMDAHACIKNISGADVNASLTLSVDKEATGGMVGFCGWGTTVCEIISSGKSLKRRTTVPSSESIDPHVEIMGPDANTVNIKVKYTLEAGSEVRILNVHFTTKGSDIDLVEHQSEIYLSKRDGNAFLHYSFPTENKRVLSVYSTTGEKVAEMELASCESTVSLPEISPGMYIYAITEDNRTIKSAKFII